MYPRNVGLNHGEPATRIIRLHCFHVPASWHAAASSLLAVAPAGVILDAMPNGLPLNYSTMWERFQVAGYDTYMIGKHHLGFFHVDYTPVRRGINEWKGYYTGNVEYFNHTSPCWHW